MLPKFLLNLKLSALIPLGGAVGFAATMVVVVHQMNATTPPAPQVSVVARQHPAARSKATGDKSVESKSLAMADKKSDAGYGLFANPSFGTPFDQTASLSNQPSVSPAAKSFGKAIIVKSSEADHAASGASHSPQPLNTSLTMTPSSGGRRVSVAAGSSGGGGGGGASSAGAPGFSGGGGGGGSSASGSGGSGGSRGVNAGSGGGSGATNAGSGGNSGDVNNSASSGDGSVASGTSAGGSSSSSGTTSGSNTDTGGMANIGGGTLKGSGTSGTGTGTGSGTNNTSTGSNTSGTSGTNTSSTTTTYTYPFPVPILEDGKRIGPDGWTHIKKSPDTRVIYVSSSTGNDRNNGLTPQQAVKTLGHGFALMRDGYPDWLLLKRGDSWDEPLGVGYGSHAWYKNGRSADEPMVISTYGTGARPIIHPNHDPMFTAANNMAVFGLNFYADRRDPSSPNYNASNSQGVLLRQVGGKDHILIEDCKFSYGDVNIIIQGYSGSASGWPSDIVIRRNVITDSYSSGGGHSQGLYLEGDTGIVIEDNIFDHNGWNEPLGIAATTFNHDIYIHGGNNVLVRDNVLARASNFGLKLRADTDKTMQNVTVEDNLFYETGNSLSVGGTNSAADFDYNNLLVHKNVITEIGRQFGDSAQGLGITIERIENGTIDSNYFVHKPYNGFTHIVGIRGKIQKNVVIKNNVVYDWKDPFPPTQIVHLYHTSIPGYTTSGNDVDKPASTYVDPSRTVTDYAKKVLLLSGKDQLYQKWRAMDKDSWNQALTAHDIVDWIAAGFSYPPNYD